MKTHSTISKKLTAGLCTILLATFVMSCTTPGNNNDLSLAKLKECKLVVTNSHLLTKNWVYIDRNPDTHDKRALKNIQDEYLPKLQAELMELAKTWNATDSKELESVFTFVNDSLFACQKEIMKALNSIADYNDLFTVMEAQSMVEYGGGDCPDGAAVSAANKAIARLDKLIEKFDKKTE